MRDTSRYVVDSVRVPSVTECLAIAGLTDFSRVPADRLETARERGSDLHDWRDAMDAGLIDDDMVPPQAIAMRVAAWRKFVADTSWMTTRSEHVVVNSALRYAGQLDALGTMNGIRGEVLIDTKATAAIYPWTRLQLCGYAMAMDPRPAARCSVQLKSDGTYRLDWYKERSDETMWISTVHVTHWKLAHGLARLDTQEEQAA